MIVGIILVSVGIVMEIVCRTLLDKVVIPKKKYPLTNPDGKVPQDGASSIFGIGTTYLGGYMRYREEDKDLTKKKQFRDAVLTKWSEYIDTAPFDRISFLKPILKESVDFNVLFHSITISVKNEDMIKYIKNNAWKEILGFNDYVGLPKLKIIIETESQALRRKMANLSIVSYDGLSFSPYGDVYYECISFLYVPIFPLGCYEGSDQGASSERRGAKRVTTTNYRFIGSQPKAFWEVFSIYLRWWGALLLVVGILCFF